MDFVIHRFRGKTFVSRCDAAFARVLLSFSLYTNGLRIFNTRTKSGQISCVHGIRVLSMFWIIFGHTYYWGIPYLNNLMDGYKLPNNIANQILLNGSLSVDPFFFLSGMLLTYLWLKNVSSSMDKIKSWNLWLKYYLHRYLRLTPVYMIVLAFNADTLRFVTDGPMWSQNGFEPNYCANSWWTNALYINNFIHDEECMTWSWYLANDMQFYMLAPIILLLFIRFVPTPSFNMLFNVFVLLGIRYFRSLSSLRSFLQAASFVHGLFSTTIGLLSHFSQLTRKSWFHCNCMSLFHCISFRFEIFDLFWDQVYIKPYTRCAPFLIGILVGYFLCKTKMSVQIPKALVAFCWILNTALGLVIVFGLCDYSRTNQISFAWRLIYSAFGRTVWSVVIAWVTFACATGYGGKVSSGPVNTFLSWKVWTPLSRLVYSAYLIHPVLIRSYYASQNRPMHFGDHFQMVTISICSVGNEVQSEWMLALG
ncbi:unnamed protein product [Soboliphyme baturini]|uniref:Acyl_transf_3 domain-containing protein n=1 Tax=Soboliphyme baturini TaxID=241478 RepID=A0A183J6S6_9BILA|nr:unnamed protein product [Soboliphyme baturini]